MSGAELGRRRRCRVLQLAIAIGILLPIFQPSWITLGSALVGIAVLAFVYRRECRDESEEDSAQ
ncbi:MAG TPA: hypothetical protein VE289_02110 [Gaiellaceae bacterium]|jgi:hypothetical protein|nr:hypothetical protein [Gaiellaceae bacterium]